MNGREGLREREAGRAAAHSRLLAAIATEVDHGGRVPCLDPARADLWTSEAADDLEAAAFACSGCPALAACRAYVDQFEEVAGVWAGMTPTERKQ